MEHLHLDTDTSRRKDKNEKHQCLQKVQYWIPKFDSFTGYSMYILFMSYKLLCINLVKIRQSVSKLKKPSILTINIADGLYLKINKLCWLRYCIYNCIVMDGIAILSYITFTKVLKILHLCPSVTWFGLKICSDTGITLTMKKSLCYKIFMKDINYTCLYLFWTNM